MAKTYLCLFFLGKLGSFTIKLVVDNHKRYNHATEKNLSKGTTNNMIDF